jgi:hypothetical protein
MKFWTNISNIDKRWIYLLIAIVIIFPFFIKLDLPVSISPPTQSLYDFIDSIPNKDNPIIISFDYDPSTQGELTPMAIALMRHAFSNNQRVISMSFWPQGIGLAEEITSNVAKEFDKVEGKDYVVMPYIPGVSAVVLSIGEDIKKTFVTDYYGNKTDTLECLRNVKNYKQIPIVISLAGSSSPYIWIIYAYTKHGQLVGVGTTAVAASAYYPYLRTKQIVGMLGGLKGAAEYELLIKTNKNVKGRQMATIGMNSQSFGHLAMILLIIVGNISYFVIRKQKGEKA